MTCGQMVKGCACPTPKKPAPKREPRVRHITTEEAVQDEMDGTSEEEKNYGDFLIFNWD